MKKIIACLFSGLLICSSMFAGIFNSRIFEIKVNTPVDFGNNVFTMDRLLQEEVVIDFKEIANSIPESGLNLKTALAPKLEINLNILKLHVGVNLGLDLYGSVVIGKDLFDFIGIGYKYGEKKTFSANVSSESFISLGVDVGFKSRKFKINLSPSVFVPVFVVRTDKAAFEFKNSKNGEFNALVNGHAVMYSQFTGDESGFMGLDFMSLNGENGAIPVSKDNKEAIIEYLCSVAGFDFAGSAEVPVFPGFRGIISFRFPVLPGKLNTKTDVTVSYSQEVKGEDLLGGDVDFSKFTDFDYATKSTSELYKANRPLKLDGYLKFAPLGDWLYVKAGAGIGISAPFSDDAYVYPEYIVEGSVSLLSGLVGASLSTEYTNEIYIHRLGLSFGMRATQLDLGLSLESPLLSRSFNFSGLGVNLAVAVGF